LTGVERAAVEGRGMRSNVVLFWLGTVGFFAVSALIAYLVAPTSNQSFADAAAVITFASLLAVGIERVIEFFWILLDGRTGYGGYFPLTVIMQQFDAVDAQTNQLLGKVFDDTKKALQDAKPILDQADAAAAATGAQVVNVDAVVRDLELQRNNLAARLAQVSKLAPGSGRLGATAAIADQMSSAMHTAVSGIEVADVAVQNAIVAVQQSIATVRAGAKTAVDVIGALGDNPSRRIASLLFSSGLGILVAGFVGVNLFRAVLESSQGEAEAVLFGKVGVIVTGMVVGLGSGPTHELVKGLQRYKDSKGRTAVADLSTDLGQTVRSMAGGGMGAQGEATDRPQIMVRSTH
jgi:hypothetical protein